MRINLVNAVEAWTSPSEYLIATSLVLDADEARHSVLFCDCHGFMWGSPDIDSSDGRSIECPITRYGLGYA